MAEIRLAKITDIDDITKIIKQAQRFIKSNNIDQWQNGYPDKNTLINDIQNENLFVAITDSETAGIIAIIKGREPTYDKIYEGKWISESAYITIHRFAVGDKYRNKGIGNLLFSFAERYAEKNDIYSLRVDTHKDNIPMRSLIDKCGFTYCGIIYIDGGDERVAYEKILEKNN